MTIEELDRPLEVGDAVILTSGDSFSFAGPFPATVVAVDSLVNGKVAVLVEITDVPTLGLNSRSPKLRSQYWLVAKGGHESLASLSNDAVISVHIAETAKKPGDTLLPTDFKVEAWGEVRRSKS
jgi:hypothetical protein